MTPDKRVLQYLNQEGFGHRYPGNAEDENYVTVGDTFSWYDAIDKAKRNGSAKIEIDGRAYFEGIGAVHVAGMTRNQLEAYLTQKFAAIYKESDVKILSLGAGTNKYYYLFGEVSGPGRRDLKPDLTLFDALFAPNQVKDHRANLGRVKLIRSDPSDPLVLILDVRPHMQFGDSTDNVQIHERDIIVVPPTLLAQLGNMLSSLITPFTTVLNEVTISLFRVNQLNNLGNNNNFGVGLF